MSSIGCSDVTKYEIIKLIKCSKYKHLNMSIKLCPLGMECKSKNCLYRHPAGNPGIVDFMIKYYIYCCYLVVFFVFIIIIMKTTINGEL